MDNCPNLEKQNVEAVSKDNLADINDISASKEDGPKQPSLKNYQSTKGRKICANYYNLFFGLSILW